MVKRCFIHTLAWSCLGLTTVAQIDDGLRSSRQLTKRAGAIANIINPPSFPPYTYAGCYEDVYGINNAPLLNGPTFTSNTQTYQTCATFCSGYAYFGIENGNVCKCGTSLPPTTLIPPVLPVPDLLCNVACSGNLNQNCGASGLLVVFRAPAVAISSSSISSAISIYLPADFSMKRV